MDTQLLQTLQNKISDLEVLVNDMNRKISTLELDKQFFLKKNDKILPGLSTKIAFDENGLIIGNAPLTNSDIPNIEIEKINGLKEILYDKANRSDLNNIKLDLDTIFASRDITSTGCKINYDKYGVIQSSSDLTEADIPRLSISHIIDLEEKLNMLIKSIPNMELNNSNIVSPDTACKVTYNENGNITSSSELNMNDLPSELISRINIIESKLVTMVGIDNITEIREKLDNKLDSNPEIAGGICSKVKIDKHGLVVETMDLVPKDLNITIDDVNNLNNLLLNKVDRSELTNLSTTVSMLVDSFNKITDTSQLEESIKNKVDISEVDNIKSTLSKINSKLEVLLSVDNKYVIDSILSIRNEIKLLDNRILKLESNN